MIVEDFMGKEVKLVVGMVRRSFGQIWPPSRGELLKIDDGMVTVRMTGQEYVRRFSEEVTT